MRITNGSKFVEVSEGSLRIVPPRQVRKRRKLRPRARPMRGHKVAELNAVRPGYTDYFRRMYLEQIALRPTGMVGRGRVKDGETKQTMAAIKKGKDLRAMFGEPPMDEIKQAIDDFPNALLKDVMITLYIQMKESTDPKLRASAAVKLLEHLKPKPKASTKADRDDAKNPWDQEPDAGNLPSRKAK